MLSLTYGSSTGGKSWQEKLSMIMSNIIDILLRQVVLVTVFSYFKFFALLLPATFFMINFMIFTCLGEDAEDSALASSFRFVFSCFRVQLTTDEKKVRIVSKIVFNLIALPIMICIFFFKTQTHDPINTELCKDFCPTQNTTLSLGTDIQFCGSLSVLPIEQQELICYIAFVLFGLSFIELILERFVSFMPFNIFYKINHPESANVPAQDEEESAL